MWIEQRQSMTQRSWDGGQKRLREYKSSVFSKQFLGELQTMELVGSKLRSQGVNNPADTWFIAGINRNYHMLLGRPRKG